MNTSDERKADANKTKVTVRVAGHEIALNVTAEERSHVERAAENANQAFKDLGGKMAAANPAKVGAMVAFQFACDLSFADEMLDEAQKLHEELRRQKEAVARLEGLLTKVDNALAC